jgi:hypothetical protein
MASLMLGQTSGVIYKRVQVIGHFHLELKLKKYWSYNSTPPCILPGVVFNKYLSMGQIYLRTVLLNRIHFDSLLVVT